MGIIDWECSPQAKATKTTRERPSERLRQTQGCASQGRQNVCPPNKTARPGPVIGRIEFKGRSRFLKLGGTATAVAPIRGGGVFHFSELTQRCDDARTQRDEALNFSLRLCVLASLR